MTFSSKADRQKERDWDWFQWIRTWSGPYRIRRNMHGTGQITIPKDVCEKFGLEEKYDVTVVEGKDRAVQMMDRGIFDDKVIVVMHRQEK